MFDLRLALALGKSLKEVRALSYPEVLLWRQFYLLEPWGFEEEEFRAARLLTQMHNQAVDKVSKQRPISAFIRNMQDLVIRALRRAQPSKSVPDLDTPEGQAQATEIAVRNFKKMFPGKVVDARKKL